MSSKVIVIAFALVIFAAMFYSCRRSQSSRPGTTPLVFNIPPGFPEPIYDFTANPVSEEGFALGKKLFHDNRLSKFADVTCGSCHQQLAAYTTFDHDLGHGTNFQHTTRNVPSIFNMVWQPSFQWDGSVERLVDQPLTCLTAPERMGETVNGIIAKLDTISAYKELFQEAFGDQTITEERLTSAITQFVAMIVSANSRYDKVKRGEQQFTANESAGYELFKTNCASCHAEPLFTDFSYRNIGLPHRDFHEDAGRMLVTGNSSDSLKFRVPSLRNVAVTSYYAHDGRFAGITEILKHYSEGVEQSPTLDPLLQEKIPLSNLERFYLMEFLFTLTDSSMINDPKFK